MDQLLNTDNFEELQVDPTEDVKEKIVNFCEKWKDELKEFQTNIINFLTNTEGSHPSTVKGPDGKHDITITGQLWNSNKSSCAELLLSKKELSKIMTI